MPSLQKDHHAAVKVPCIRSVHFKTQSHFLILIITSHSLLRRPLRGNGLSLMSFLVAGQCLCELRPLAYSWSFPIEDVDWNGKDESQTGKNGGRVLKSEFGTEIFVDCEVVC